MTNTVVPAQPQFGNVFLMRMQTDGNLVLYHPLWATNTYFQSQVNGPYATPDCSSVGSALFYSQTLPTGSCLVSESGRYELKLQSDGNLALYDLSTSPATLLWASGTGGQPVAYATTQTDGNFVLYGPSGNAVWATDTNQSSPAPQLPGFYVMTVQDDGNLVLMHPMWASNTNTTWVAGPYPSPGCTSIGPDLFSNQVLPTGSCLLSENGRFKLVLQTDGNLVLYDLSQNPAPAVWNTVTAVNEMPFSYPYVSKYFYNVLDNLTCVEQHGDASGQTGCSADASNDATSVWRIRRFHYDALGRLTQASNPESGTSMYFYDADGNLTSKISPQPNQTNPANGVVTSYCYDELHRLTGKKYAAGSCPLSSPDGTFSYDQGTNGNGRRTAMNDGSGSASWAYDSMGRIAAESRTINGVNKSIGYAYNFDGSLAAITYPSGRVVQYQTSGAGRPVSATDSAGPINYVSAATYFPNGALGQYGNGNSGITVTNSYNKRWQPITLSATASSQTLFNLSYDFHLGSGDNGNVYQIVNNRDGNRTQNFSYDELNRIQQAWTTGPSWGETFSIDPWGNLTNRSGITGKTFYEPLAAAPATIQNRLNVNSYDIAGNVMSDGSGSYVYDNENRLISASGWTYVYDGDGKRVKKTNGSSGTLYWTGAGSDALAESDLTGNLQSEYVFFNGKRVARRDVASGNVHYYLSDHLGSHSVIASASGGLEKESDYYPYGGEIAVSGSDPNHYKFTAKERDSESGLDYFGARHYASTMGRFVSPDSLGGHLFDPPFNKYSYVRNNSLSLTDPTGLDLWLKDCGDETDTCHKNYVGTWDEAHKNFTSTTIQSDESGNFDGHSASFDSSGIHIDDRYQGVYAPGTDATRVNGTEGSAFEGTHFLVNSNCLGTCLAGGALYSNDGRTSVFVGVIDGLEGPNKSFDVLSGHAGDQYRGANASGPDAHLSYITDSQGSPVNGMPFHIDTRNPFHSGGGLFQHTTSLMQYEFKARILGMQAPPLPSDIRRGE
jgi:RHS repeat-associated protein